MPEPEIWTIGRLLTWTAEFLKKHGAESPRLDAEVLLAHARKCQRIQLYTAYDEVASDDLRREFRELVVRRSKGAPVAYLVGHKEFYSLTFRVTPDVLIPRPETEFLVVEALDAIKKYGPTDRPPQVADIGVGSGCIAITVARQAKTTQLTAVDLSAAALDVARGNARDLGVAERIEFLEGDLLAPIARERRFDLILSNPPYIGEGEEASLPRDVREHEPRSALIAGPTGVETIARLISQSAERLTAGGWLMFEFGPVIEPQVRRLLEQDERWEASSVVKDLAGLPRVMKVRRRAAAE